MYLFNLFKKKLDHKTYSMGYRAGRKAESMYTEIVRINAQRDIAKLKQELKAYKLIEKNR